MNRFVLLLAVCLCATSLFADVERLVGKDAPEFKAASTVKETDYRTLEDCVGDVVVLRFT